MSRKPTDDIQEVIESIYKQSILFVNCFAGELAGNRIGSNSLNAKVAVIWKPVNWFAEEYDVSIWWQLERLMSYYCIQGAIWAPLER